jgi:hypothetical protein
MASWKETSEMGFEFEDFVLEDINKKVLPLAYKNTIKENYSFYDIILFKGNFGEQSKTLECKYDEKASHTGNICIEVGCNGRASGLLVTTADYWLIGDGYIGYLIETTRIREYILENGNEIIYKPKCLIKQEDGVYKEMDIYLIKKSIFEKYCSEINNIDDMKYDCLK